MLRLVMAPPRYRLVIAGLGLTLHSLTPLEAENGEAEVTPQRQPAGVNDHRPGTN